MTDAFDFMSPKKSKCQKRLKQYGFIIYLFYIKESLSLDK